MKILLATYSAESHSSYGLVTRELWTRLWNMNPSWEVYQQGWYHKSNESVPWRVEPTKFVPTPAGPKPLHEDRWGQVTFEPIVQRYRPDLVWTLGDAFMFEHMDRYRKSFGLRIVKHVAIDGAPVPKSWGDSLLQSDGTIPITEFGARALEPVVGKVFPWIYHGVDVNRFTPVSRKDRQRPADGLMTDKTFVLGFVGHSQWRKQPWNLFKLVRYLRDGAFVICDMCDEATLAPWDDIWGRPMDLPKKCSRCQSESVSYQSKQDVVLWYHTFDRANVEYHPELMKAIWGLDKAVIFTSKMTDTAGAPDTEMPSLYKMFDAYISLSGAEGFCIPLIEAMATGLPVIYTDYSGQAEVGAYGGLPVRYIELQPNTGIPINRAIADVAHAVRQVMRLMTDKALYDRLARKGITAAREVFNWDVIALQWDEAIKKALNTKYVKTIGFTAT